MEAGEVDRLVVGLAYQVDAASEAKAKASAADIERAGKDAAEAWRVGMQGAAAAAAAALVGLAVSTAHTADELHDLGIRMGLTVEEVQSLGYAADRSGTSLEVLGTGLMTLQRQIGAARHGSAEAAAAFGALGIDPAKLGKAKDALPAVADALLRVTDDAERARLRMTLLGEAGPRMAELLDQGSEGLADLTRRAATFQGVITSAEADLAGDFLDDLSDLGLLAKRAAHALGFELLHPLRAIVGEFHDWAASSSLVAGSGIEGMLAKIPQPAKAAALAGVGLAGAWGALGVTRELAEAAAAGSPLVQMLLDMANNTLSIAGAVGPYAVALAGAALVMEDFAVAADGGDAAVLRLAESMGIRGEAQRAIKGISDLLGETADTAWVLADALGEGVADAIDRLARMLPSIAPYLDQLSGLLRGGAGGALDWISEQASLATSGGKAIRQSVAAGGLDALLGSGLLGPRYVAPGVYERGGQLYAPTDGAGGGTVNVPVTINTAGLSRQQIADAAAAEVRRQVLDAQQALGGG